MNCPACSVFGNNNVSLNSNRSYPLLGYAATLNGRLPIRDRCRRICPVFTTSLATSNAIRPGIGPSVRTWFGPCSFKPCRCPLSRAVDFRIGEDVISPDRPRPGGDVAHPKRPKARRRVDGQRQREVSLPTSNDNVRTSHGSFPAGGAKLLDG